MKINRIPISSGIIYTIKLKTKKKADKTKYFNFILEKLKDLVSFIKKLFKIKTIRDNDKKKEIYP